MVTETVPSTLPNMTKPTSPRSAVSRSRGFTAVELLITFMILAILLALAAPSFTRLMDRFRVDAGLNDLANAIQLARSEAVRTGADAIVTPLSGCTNAVGWSCGVRVLADVNGTGVPTVIKETGEHQGLTIEPSATGDLTFRSVGTVTVPRSFLAFPTGKSPGDEPATTMCLARGGRLTRVPLNPSAC